MRREDEQASTHIYEGYIFINSLVAAGKFITEKARLAKVKEVDIQKAHNG